MLCYQELINTNSVIVQPEFYRSIRSFSFWLPFHLLVNYFAHQLVCLKV